eukprot:1373728-Pleurochrysis_carterae.AAC.1
MLATTQRGRAGLSHKPTLCLKAARDHASHVSRLRVHGPERVPHWYTRHGVVWRRTLKRRKHVAPLSRGRATRKRMQCKGVDYPA